TDPLLGDRQQRPYEAVELVLRAVVGVQGHVDRVLFGHLGGVRRERHRTGDHVLHRGAGQVLRPAGGDLDDAVAVRVGEAAQRRVERLRGGHVDRRVRVPAGLGTVEHLGVDLGRGDGHGCSLTCVAVRVRTYSTLTGKYSPTGWRPFPGWCAYGRERTAGR